MMKSENLTSAHKAKDDVFFVDGMDCSEEVAAIERMLKPISGVFAVRAEIVPAKVVVSHDGQPTRAELTAAINEAGVTVRATGEEANRQWVRPGLVSASGLATGIGLLLQWIVLGGELLPDAAFLVAVLTGGTLVLPKALRSLRNFSLDINVLMVVAVTGAIAIGEIAEGAAVVFLFSLSELLESWSVGRARRAIQALLALTPDTAFVRREILDGDCPYLRGLGRHISLPDHPGNEAEGKGRHPRSGWDPDLLASFGV